MLISHKEGLYLSMGLIIDGFSHILPKSFIRELSLSHPTDELRESGSLTT
jgi:hypothetical protein